MACTLVAAWKRLASRALSPVLQTRALHRAPPRHSWSPSCGRHDSWTSTLCFDVQHPELVGLCAVSPAQRGRPWRNAPCCPRETGTALPAALHAEHSRATTRPNLLHQRDATAQKTEHHPSQTTPHPHSPSADAAWTGAVETHQAVC